MSDRLTMIGTHVAPYGLVVVLLWIGGMKFTAYESEAIRPMVANRGMATIRDRMGHRLHGFYTFAARPSSLSV